MMMIKTIISISVKPRRLAFGVPRLARGEQHSVNPPNAARRTPNANLMPVPNVIRCAWLAVGAGREDVVLRTVIARDVVDVGIPPRVVAEAVLQGCTIPSRVVRHVREQRLQAPITA